MTIKGDDRMVPPEALDAWVPVCERILSVVSEHLKAKATAAHHNTEAQDDAER
jgi:hypothetical protein